MLRTLSVLLMLVVAAVAGCGDASAPDPARAPLGEEILRADTRLSQADPEAAIEILGEVLAVDPASFHAHYRLGVLHLFDDPPAAREHLRRARELSPRSAGPVFFEGLLDAVENRSAEAESLMAEGVRLAAAGRDYALPDTGATLRAALEAVAARRPGAAIPVLAERADARPSDAVLRYLHADAVFESGEVKEALILARRARDLDPDFLEAAALEAACLYRLREEAEGRRVVDEVLARDPHHSLGLFVSGLLFIEDSEYRPGMVHLWQAILAEPTDPERLEALGTVFMRYGNPEWGSRLLQLMEGANSFLGRHLRWPGYVAEY